MNTIKIRKTIEQYSDWAEIKSTIDGGYLNLVLSEGDKISFKLKDGKDVTVTVAAVDLYNTNEVIFVFDELYWISKMNDNNRVYGGWCGSNMKLFLDGLFSDLFPDVIQKIAKPREIVQIINDERFSCHSYLWLPSRTEVFGLNDNYKDIDFGDRQFPIFKKGISRVKSDPCGCVESWWLRSAYYYTSYGFCSVDTYGDADYYSAYYSYGVAPAFII